jgi:hypothetical protein
VTRTCRPILTSTSTTCRRSCATTPVRCMSVRDGERVVPLYEVTKEQLAVMFAEQRRRDEHDGEASHSFR